MNKFIMSIYDSQLKSYINIVTVDKQEAFIRDIKTIVNEIGSKSNLTIYPEQFVIYCLGIFNDETGVITSKVESLLPVISLLNKEVK